MVQVDLSFRARIALSELLGTQARGNVRTLRSYNLAYEQVRISEALAREVGVQTIPLNATSVRLTWDEAAAEQAGVTLTLEAQDAERIAALMDEHEGWTIADYPWVTETIAGLRRNGNGAQ